MGSWSSLYEVLARDLEQALAALPPLTRAVVWLYDVEGWTHPEIAEAVGLQQAEDKGDLHMRIRRTPDGGGWQAGFRPAISPSFWRTSGSFICPVERVISSNRSVPNFSQQKLASVLPTMIARFMFSKL